MLIRAAAPRAERVAGLPLVVGLSLRVQGYSTGRQAAVLLAVDGDELQDTDPGHVVGRVDAVDREGAGDGCRPSRRAGRGAGSGRSR